MNQDAVARVRAREYPRQEAGIFFNAASWGLLPASAAQEVADLTLRRNRVRGVDEEELGRIQRRCRAAVATLLQVGTDEIALAPNTSYGVNLAAALVASGPSGTILVAQGEFPANVFPWKALEPRGFRVEVVPADAWGRPREEELLRRLDGPGIRALALSAVQFASGHRADLRAFGEACRRRDVLFCVDAIQALGAVPLHPREAFVDVLAA
ncbi:MAG TPA: aminotransferase class V-fold PLP-dependent enzyme, partial [Longimicrobiales bacterium]|nr:aminotransferase class V-fold PLP-dependent enzyme [Longimicrobiales bacterium]